MVTLHSNIVIAVVQSNIDQHLFEGARLVRERVVYIVSIMCWYMVLYNVDDSQLLFTVYG